jgi:hypothetical protein
VEPYVNTIKENDDPLHRPEGLNKDAWNIGQITGIFLICQLILLLDIYLTAKSPQLNNLRFNGASGGRWGCMFRLDLVYFLD